MDKKPSELFVRCFNRVKPKINDFYQNLKPNYTIDSETGISLEENQNKFEAEIEDWILANEKLLALYIKTRAKEEFEKAQTKFNFCKDL